MLAETIAEAGAALELLEARGAYRYDAPACACVRQLLTRAEELAGDAGERIAARAQAHVDALAERFERAQTRVSERLSELEAAHGAQETLRAALDHGDITRVARATRRIAACPARALGRRERSAGEHEPRRFARTATRRARTTVYEDSVAELVASFALARAVDVVPDHAGPYNPLRIASDALDSMRELSPFYLTVQLNRLEELATLLSLPELPTKIEEKALPKKKKPVLKG